MPTGGDEGRGGLRGGVPRGQLTREFARINIELPLENPPLHIVAGEQKL